MSEDFRIGAAPRSFRSCVSFRFHAEVGILNTASLIGELRTTRTRLRTPEGECIEDVLFCRVCCCPSRAADPTLEKCVFDRQRWRTSFMV